ncbi:MAG: hypothetical protein Q9214_001630 [Letrouitia sp. 1 TL-2023]
MAPYRNNRTSNRSGRTQNDHDVVEGLPVRHWRKAPVTLNSAPQKDDANTASNRNSMWSELPMPRDYQLLPPVSQALLRAARSGEVIRKPAPQPLVEDEKGTGEDDEAEGDVDTGFVAKRWAPIPRHLEEPEPEYLAKRRRGLPSAYDGAQGQDGTTGPMRKTKVRKLDLEGNAAVLEVLVPEGQKVDGEVFEEETKLTEAPAPGTVVEGVGVANAEGIVVAGDTVVPPLPPPPPRRRPPPPKRRPKGPGRGRKKKVAFAPGAEGTDGVSTTPGTSHLTVTGPNGGVKILNETAIDGDVDMKDDSVMQNGDESSDDEEEGDEGEEGEEVEEGEEGDTGARELSLAASSLKSPAEQVLPPLSSKMDDEIQESSEVKMDSNPVIIDRPSTPPIPQEAQEPASKDLSSSPEFPLAKSQNGDAQRNSVEPPLQDDHAQPTKIDDDPTQSQSIDPADEVFVQSLAHESPHEVHFQPVLTDLIRDAPAISVAAEPIHDESDQPAIALPDMSDQASSIPAAPSPDRYPQPMTIDPVQEADVAPAPDLDRISPSNQVVVEEAPPFEEQRFPITDEKPPEVVIAASLPLHHDPVDGLAPPTPEAFTPKDEREAAEREAAERAEREALEVEAMDQDAHFTDGEVDLLGSLEKQLDGRNSEFHDT